jgi:hypothetical protein
MLRGALLLGLMSAVAGCNLGDPYQRAGNWRPNGSNERNVRVLAANPADLERGQRSAGTEGQRAAAAIDRLRLDRVKALPDSGIARFTQSGFGNSAGGGAP